MSSSLYFKLAKTNLKENRKTYFPYMLACLCAVIMFYTMDCIALTEGIKSIRGAGSLRMILSYGVKVVAVFSIVFLFYTNSFLIKRRKKEIGLYNVLGMEKKHIGRVLAIETLIVALSSLVLGVLGGIIIGRLLFLILIGLMKLDVTISASFSISVPAIIQTIELFAIIFIVILITNLFQVKMANPIELLQGGQKGEKEPKASWILAISGVIELAVGYGIAVTIESPLKALMSFFIAVILVIVGTYSTFTAGSIALLKLLKKNKKFFYKTNNFVSVSGMIYRMKQNAVGLASICILSTAVLITLSTTFALYAGQEESLKVAHPLDAEIAIRNASAEEKNKVLNMIKEDAAKNDVTIKNQVQYDSIHMIANQNQNKLKTAEKKDTFASSVREISFFTVEDYAKMEGKEVSLKDNEVLIFSVVNEYNYDSIIINGKEYKVKDKLNEIKVTNKNKNNIIEAYTIIAKDVNVIKDMCNNNLEFSEYDTNFDIQGNKDNITKYCDALSSHISSEKVSFKSIYTSRKDFYIFNGGFIFIGSFLGLLFALGTVLIIYYKQISEGYDDCGRFQIMQKVGMSKAEVKKTINKQVLMVFFLPLIVAVIHIAFAFKVVSKLLCLFGLFSTSTLIIAIAATIVIFAVAYVIVYTLTAKTYYNIVQQ
jgi:putative ABC transport system permease protein